VVSKVSKMLYGLIHCLASKKTRSGQENGRGIEQMIEVTSLKLQSLFLSFLVICGSSAAAGTEAICRLALCRFSGADCFTDWNSFEPDHLLTVHFPGYIDGQGFHHSRTSEEDRGHWPVRQEMETEETLSRWASPRGELVNAILEMKPAEKDKPPKIRFVSGIATVVPRAEQFTDSFISAPIPLGDFRTEAGEQRLLLEWARHNNALVDAFSQHSDGKPVFGNQLVIVVQDSEGLRGVPITPEEFGIAQSVAYNLQKLYALKGAKIPPNKAYMMKVTEDPKTGNVLIFGADPANEPD
jgi:hypothetical protein